MPSKDIKKGAYHPALEHIPQSDTFEICAFVFAPSVERVCISLRYVSLFQDDSG
jgi:hypothetical protein